MKKKKPYTPYTHDERLAILTAYDNSGQSLHDFCGLTGVNKRTVSNWLKERRHQTGLFAPETAKQQSFVPLQIPQDPQCVPCSTNQEVVPSPTITITRQDWQIAIPGGCDRTDVYHILSALEDLYAV